MSCLYDLFPCCFCFRGTTRYRSDSDYVITKYNNVEPPSADKSSQSQVQTNEILRLFRRFAGSDGQITPYELRDLLNSYFTQEFVFEGFSTELCRSMVCMHDTDLSGKLDFSEFHEIWKDLTLWQSAFKERDIANKGYFKTSEFEEILNNVGLNVNADTVRVMSVRYSDETGKVRFGDFVACAVKMKNMIETYRSKKTDYNGNARFSTDEFLQLALYS